MYERRREPLLSRAAFLRRQIAHGAVAAAIVLGSLGLGIGGYHFLEGLDWIDALVNASMILGGMGPVNPLQTLPGKLFASFYALYSGMIFLIAAGVLFAPLLHRFMHAFHLEDEPDGSGSPGGHRKPE